MAYVAIARKYRPQTFDEVVGQKDVIEAIKRAITEERLHHGYIFSGTRGVGKTTMARILAKSLNCLSSDKPTVSPCGICESCKSIQDGNSVDVIEIDGASNNGVDNIRELRENVKFAPVYSRYKIYIVDEVHRITANAFDALLKTLEEPPPHVKFIFATTELNKVPVTILSRCQKFNFDCVPPDALIEKLRRVAAKENVTVGDEVYRYVAKAAMGSMRDAESLFDQIVPMLMSGADLDALLDVLGEIKEFAVLDFLDAVVGKDAAKALTSIDTYVKQGKDLEKFLDAVVDAARNVLLVKVLKEKHPELTSIPADLKAGYDALAQKADAGLLVKVVDSLIDTKRISRYAASLRIPFEIAVVKLVYARSAAAVQAVQAPVAASAPVTRPTPPPVRPAPTSAPAHVAPKGAVVERTVSVPKAAPTKSSSHADVIGEVFGASARSAAPAVSVPAAAKSVSTAVNVSAANLAAHWNAIRVAAGKEKAMIEGALTVAKIVDADAASVTIGFPKNADFQKETIERQANREVLADAFARVAGVRPAIKTVFTDEVMAVDTSKRTESQAFVKDVLSAFDGEMI
jgi:DNA polymerase-3 subunit gamma/tau